MLHLRHGVDPTDPRDALAGAAVMAWILGLRLVVETTCGKFILQATHVLENTAMRAQETRRTARSSIPDAARRLIALAAVVVALAACGELGASGTGATQLGDGGSVNAPYFLGGNPLFRSGSEGGE